MAEEVVRISDEFYILSTSARVDDRTRVLKQGDTFAIFDRLGDVEAIGDGDSGLYHEDTRYLSRLALRVDGVRPLLLGSSIKDDNAVFTVDLMNPDFRRDDELTIARGDVHLFRSKVLWQAACYERLRLHNYASSPVELNVTLRFDADFADIFEVRGTPRALRGRRLPAEISRDAVRLAYQGLDGRVRAAHIAFAPPPTQLSESAAVFAVKLAPRAEADWQMTIRCDSDATAPAPPILAWTEAARRAVAALESVRADEPAIHTSNEQFNDWLNRSLADLRMMRTQTPHGPYPYAGVPWFSTVFGRDGIITALQCLWFDPGLARGVLQLLAATQADHVDEEQDAQPGKVLHETRAGEMAALGEVPFRRYYGTVDATPLFVVLAGAYCDRTADVAFLRTLWPHVERALDWIDRYGDCDGDGFVEYARHTPRGLLHQGWKDSHDSVFHHDGAAAEPPIALAEVQGYVYAAKRAASTMASVLGDTARSQALAEQAETLRRRFEAAFWCEELSTYAIALDGRKQPCRVVTSNAGHCLFAGIAGEQRARRVAATLLEEPSFSGWGIRTVAATEARYNPMSYHNGSIWPHDNALVAAGFARYGLREQAEKVLTALFDASLFFDQHRLPELFCGFARRPGEAPTLYPVSCAPQAWAAGAPLLLLQSSLGMQVQAARREIAFFNPRLPDFLQFVRVRDLRIGDACLDLEFVRHPRNVGVNIERRVGEVSVVVVK